MADVAIIGAGIIGCAIAEELGRRGARVSVFDAREIGAGATQASAGILAPYVEGHQRGPLLDQGVRSLDLYDAFVARVAASSGLEIEYLRCGTLEVADTEERFESLRRGSEGTPDPVEWVPREALAGFEAGVGADLPGARFCQAHGYVVVHQLLEALVASARRSHVEFHEHATVAHVEDKGGRFTLRTTAGDFTASTVIVCAGGWSSQLEFAAELEGRVRPIRGQLVRLRWRGEPLRHILWSSGCYIVPWQDGTVLVGATAEDVGYEERATVTGVRDLLDAACEVMPPLWNADFLGVKVGLRPASTDGLPIVRASERTPGLFFATGHFRNGILLAPLTAVHMGDIIFR
jgi:glycine oxidase